MTLTILNSATAAAGRAARLPIAAALLASALAGCANTPVAPRLSSGSGPVCADVSFPIYFATGSDQLTDPARQAISAGQAQAHGCAVREVDVFGLADADGPSGRNMDLSRRRASAVAQALVATGLPRPLFDVQGLGESGARTARGAPAMLQRKTLVVIHVARTA